MPIQYLYEEINIPPAQLVDVVNRLIRVINNNASIYAAQVPAMSCTMRQFRAALTYYGQLIAVDSAVSADVNDPVNNQWLHGTGVAVGDGVWALAQTVTSWSNAQMELLLLNAITQPL